MKTLQDVFDRVAVHLVEQGQPATDDIGRCAYRGMGGMSCAVGCLIPDARYHPDIESLTADGPPVLMALPSEIRDIHGVVRVLRALQAVHDGDRYWRSGDYPESGEAFDRQQLLAALRKCASQYDLNADILLQYDA